MGDSMNGSMGDFSEFIRGRGRGRGKNRNKNFAGILQEGNQIDRENPGWFSRLMRRPKSGNPGETATVMPGPASAWSPPPARRGWWNWTKKPEEGELSTRRAEKRARLKPKMDLFDDGALPGALPPDSEVSLSREQGSPPTFGVYSPHDYITDDLSPREGLGYNLYTGPGGRGFRTLRRGGAKRKTLKKKRRVRSSTKKARGRR